MIPPHYIIVVLLLLIVNLIVFQYHKRLYMKHYKKHIVLAPQTALSKSFIYKGLIYIALVAMLAIILLYQQAEFYQQLFFGSIIGMFVPSIALLASRILYYKYIESNPTEISGSLTLHPGASKQLAITLLLQMLIPLAAIMIAIPDPFIYGFAIVMTLQIMVVSF